MTAVHPVQAARVWPLVLTAAAILLLTQGSRQSLGLFVAPIDQDTGLGVAKISLAFAIGQFTWGLAQPFFGAMAGRWGTRWVLVLGAVLMSLGTALTPLAHSSAALSLTIGLLTSVGAAAGSFAILIGGIARYLPENRRAFAAGFINAGASFGQFVFAPVLQWGITHWGWVNTLLLLAASALLVIPLAFRLTAHLDAAPPATLGTDESLADQLRYAARDRSYLLLHLAFFTCGFHVAFLVTHMPGQVAVCGLAPAVSAAVLALIGLFNITGSLGAGALCQRYRMKSVLMAMYAARALIIIAFLLAPKVPWTFYLFAAALGLTFLATVPPTAGLVGKLFGPRHLATLFGLTLVSHQTGAFFGAWLGGITVSRFGDYTWMWYADIVLALLAAVCHLPIVEARLPPRLATA